MAIDLNKRHYNKYGEKIVTETEPQPLKEEEIIPEVYPNREIYPQNENYPEREIYPKAEKYPQMKVYPEQNNYPQPVAYPQTAPAVQTKKPAPVILRVLAGIGGAMLIWFVFFFIVGIMAGANEDEEEILVEQKEVDNISDSAWDYRTYSFSAAEIEKITMNIPYTYFYVYSDVYSNVYSDDIDVSINCEEDLNLQIINENGELKIISDEPVGDFSFSFDRYINICIPSDCLADISLKSHMGVINCVDLKGETLMVDSTNSDITVTNCDFKTTDIFGSGAEKTLIIGNCTSDKMTVDADEIETYIGFLAAHELYVTGNDYLAVSDTYIDGVSDFKAGRGYFVGSVLSGDTKISFKEDVNISDCRFSGDADVESTLGEVYLSSSSTENIRLKAESYVSAELSESKENYTVIKNGVRERTGEYTINAESEEEDINIGFDVGDPDISEALNFAETSDFLS